MPWQKKSKKKAARVVRYTLKDGTQVERTYAPYTPKPQPRPRDTLTALIDAYKDSPEFRGMAQSTKTTYSIYLRPLDIVGQVAPGEVKRRNILTTRDVIASERGNAAANYFVTVARQLFNWAIDREWVEINPAAKIKKLETGHLTAWTQEQANTALAGLPEHLRRVVVLGMHTGQRRGDLCSMTWAAYDGERIRLRQQKTGAVLVLPVHPDLKAELDAWKPTATAMTMLTNADGRPWLPNNLSYHMPAALARLGLPDDLNVHGLRKLAAANLADAGCSTKQIMAVTGHRTLAMVELYTRSADQEALASAAIYRLRNIQNSTKYKNRTKN
jgi:integrase